MELLLLQQLMVARSEKNLMGLGLGWLLLLSREAKFCVFYGDTQIPLYPLFPCQLKLEKSTEYLQSLTLKKPKEGAKTIFLETPSTVVVCFVVCRFVSVFLRGSKAIKFFSYFAFLL